MRKSGITLVEYPKKKSSLVEDGSGSVREVIGELEGDCPVPFFPGLASLY